MPTPREKPDLDTLIIETVGSIVVVTDRQGRIIRFNAAGTRILGYQPHEVIGKIISEILPAPEYQPAARQHFAQLMAGETLEFPCVWLTRDGQRKQLAFLCKGVRGPSGRIEYAIGSAIDMTESVAAQQALRESEERFRTVFNDAAIGIALIDETGHYLHVNRAYCELVGYEMDELLKTDLQSITHPDDREPNLKLVNQLVNGEISNYIFEKRYITRSGEVLRVQVSSSLASGGAGRPATIIGLFENISERKRTQETMQALNETLERRVQERTAALHARTEELARSEATLREQSRILQSILDSMGDGVYVADGTGRVTMMNPAAEQLTGPIAPGSETIAERARRPWFFESDGVTPLDATELQLYRSAHGERMDDEEVLIRRPGFGQIWVSATGRPLLDESGNMRGAVLVVRDVSERKRNEADLRQANASLEKANALLTESEHHHKQLADSHLRLAREVEHRVRNNLQGLLGLVGAMRDRAPNVRAFADAMESRLMAMSHVHQLLAQRQWTALDLRALVDGSLDILRHMAPHAALTHVAGPETFISPQQVLPLTVVLVEWFTNSCKYGPHSAAGGRLDIHWDITSDNGVHLVRLHWTERGGPPIRAPITPGLGTELVQAYARRELAGRCELRYPPEGADHLIEFGMRPDAERSS